MEWGEGGIVTLMLKLALTHPKYFVQLIIGILHSRECGTAGDHFCENTTHTPSKEKIKRTFIKSFFLLLFEQLIQFLFDSNKMNCRKKIHKSFTVPGVELTFDLSVTLAFTDYNL